MEIHSKPKSRSIFPVNHVNNIGCEYRSPLIEKSSLYEIQRPRQVPFPSFPKGCNDQDHSAAKQMATLNAINVLGL